MVFYPLNPLGRVNPCLSWLLPHLVERRNKRAGPGEEGTHTANGDGVWHTATPHPIYSQSPHPNRFTDNHYTVSDICSCPTNTDSQLPYTNTARDIDNKN